MKLEEAIAIYVPKSVDPRPRANQRIKTALKKELRARAEEHLGTSWEQIVYRYSAEFLFEGDPEHGTATVALRQTLVCRGFGSPSKLPERVKLSFPQRELLED